MKVNIQAIMILEKVLTFLLDFTEQYIVGRGKFWWK